VVFKKNDRKPTKIFGDPCAISGELERAFCTSLLELGKLNFYVHTKLHVLVMGME